MSTIAVLGLGGMGSRIAQRFLAAGHDVVLWNRTSARMARLAELGAIPREPGRRRRPGPQPSRVWRRCCPRGRGCSTHPFSGASRKRSRARSGSS
ncbi:MAG: NAD(P)-binding domain-containing protein [Gaiellaceae bacterium]